jgi:hypothetical protein
MPALDKKFFSGAGELDPGESAKLEIRNLTSDIEASLSEYGWKGEAAGCIGLTLSADNRRVERGVFITVGTVGSVKEDAARMWHGGSEKVTLSIKIKNAAVFTFSEGGLTSDIIPHDRFEYTFTAKNDTGPPTVVLEAEYEEFGISDFCMRMVCNVSRTSNLKDGINIKYTVLLFPAGKDDLLRRYDMAQNAAWPGYQVMEGDFPLLVRTTTTWGCPIMPLLLSGTSLEQQPHLPSGEELRMAISAIMRNSVAAEASKSAKNLLARWRKMAANPDELVPKKGPVEWPTHLQSESGKF